MPKLGMWELIVILLIVVVLFGANRLPQLGKGLGEGIRMFKRSFGGDDDEKPATPTNTTPAQPSDQGRKQA